MLNRRGFLSSLAGVVALAKSGLKLSPAAAAIQPTCANFDGKPCGGGLCQYQVHFMAREGRMIDPTLPAMLVTQINHSEHTVWLDGAIPMDAVGRTIIMSPIRTNCGCGFIEGGLYYPCTRRQGHDGQCGNEIQATMEMPYYQARGCAVTYLGLNRS